MENRKILNQKIISLVCSLVVIGLAALMRLLPHPPNLVPITGLALISGATLAGLPALIVPLAAMLISDMVIGFHPTMPFVYGSFILIALIGKKLTGITNPLKLGAASVTSSVLFFLVTNFGMWATTAMYPKTILGLFTAYLMGIPFFRNGLIGDLFYTGVFFYGYLILSRLAGRIILQKNYKPA